MADGLTSHQTKSTNDSSQKSKLLAKTLLVNSLKEENKEERK